LKRGIDLLYTGNSGRQDEHLDLLSTLQTNSFSLKKMAESLLGFLKKHALFIDDD
jgi:hypothetical protein